MSKKTDAIKRVAVALGYGSNVSEYTSDTVAGVLKEVAVKMGVASKVSDIRTTGIVDVLDYIANNYGSEEHEPFDLARTTTKTTVTVKRGNKTLSDASDILFKGDKLKITATPDEGYKVTTLTVNGNDIESDDTVTVSGNVTIVATSTLIESESD